MLETHTPTQFDHFVVVWVAFVLALVLVGLIAQAVDSVRRRRRSRSPQC